jgi:hypothetical protein
MKWGKVWNVLFITLIMVLSTAAILYNLMVPKRSDFDFAFIRNQVPYKFGIVREFDFSEEGSEIAEYYWKESFVQVEARATTELLKKGWTKESMKENNVADEVTHIAPFYDFNGGEIILINSSPAGGASLDSPNDVTVLITRRFRRGIWSSLRTRLFAKGYQ